MIQVLGSLHHCGEQQMKSTAAAILIVSEEVSMKLVMMAMTYFHYSRENCVISDNRVSTEGDIT